MTKRYFCDSLQSDSPKLDDEEMHHLLHVMRAKVGELITVFDGRGWEAEAEIVEVRKRDLQLSFATPVWVCREPSIELCIAAAIPKGDRQQFLIEKLVELGVASFVPLSTNRSVVKSDEKSIAKLRRYAIEASKQCGRNTLMDVESSVSWSEFATGRKGYLATTEASALDINGIRQLALSQSSESKVNLRTQSDLDNRYSLTFAVGPEGGWAPEELRMAVENGWEEFTLGTRVLRMETAAIAIASYFSL